MGVCSAASGDSSGRRATTGLPSTSWRGNASTFHPRCSPSPSGIDTRPPKRQRVSFGAVTEMQSPGDRDEAGPSGSGRGVAGGGSKAACAHPVWVFDMCGLCGISKEAAAQAAGQEEDKYSRYLSAHAGGAGQVGTTSVH